jgi:glycosyltransferase involved in cell wall biosynthesis
MQSHSNKTPPTLKELPAPPSGNTGWPWTEQSDPLPETQPNGEPWPKISIVTPSYNQGQFIEETIRSVLLQGYPNLEYIVVDGGSTDETVEVLQKYDPWIDHWVSEPDDGQSDAINKGLRHCTGDIFNWINSDDFLVPEALSNIARAMDDHDGLVAEGWRMDADRSHYGQTTELSCDGLIIGHADPSAGGMFTQQAIWLRTENVKKCGGIDSNIEYAMDRDLYIRYTRHFDNLHFISDPVAVFRLHGDSKTGQGGDHFRMSQLRILKKIQQDPNFDSKNDLIRHSISRLRWKQHVFRLLESDSPDWWKAGQLIGGLLRHPTRRFDRLTLGAIRKFLIG